MSKKVTITAHEFLSIYEGRTYTSVSAITKTICKVFELDGLYTLELVAYSKAFRDEIDKKYPELRDCVASIKPYNKSKNPEDAITRLTDHANEFIEAYGSDMIEIDSMADVKVEFELGK